jgi:hypothetical protein
MGGMLADTFIEIGDFDSELELSEDFKASLAEVRTRYYRGRIQRIES